MREHDALAATKTDVSTTSSSSVVLACLHFIIQLAGGCCAGPMDHGTLMCARVVLFLGDVSRECICGAVRSGTWEMVGPDFSGFFVV